MSSEWTFQVAFDDADSEGIVFFGNYFRLAHRALEHVLPRWGIPWKDWYAAPDYGVPLRHAETDFYRPMRPGDQITVKIYLSRLGEISAQFEFDFMSATGELGARARTTHVFVGRPAMGKFGIPPAIRTALSKLEIRSTKKS